MRTAEHPTLPLWVNISSHPRHDPQGLQQWARAEVAAIPCSLQAVFAWSCRRMHVLGRVQPLVSNHHHLRHQLVQNDKE